MKIEYLKQFSKEISKLNDKSVMDNIFEVIISMKKSNSLSEISNIKKMKGHPEAYRLRIGKYRLGFYYDGEIIQLARFVKREDIYKLFP